MSNHLYQPFSRIAYPPGTAVDIDGPYDKWGEVVSVVRELDKNDEYNYVLLVRGKGAYKAGLVLKNVHFSI